MSEVDPSDALRQRLDSLESLVTFQERAIAQLDDTVRAFADRVEALEGELKRLKSDRPDDVGPQLDKPPHY